MHEIDLIEKLKSEIRALQTERNGLAEQLGDLQCAHDIMTNAEMLSREEALDLRKRCAELEGSVAELAEYKFMYEGLSK